MAQRHRVHRLVEGEPARHAVAQHLHDGALERQAQIVGEERREVFLQRVRAAHRKAPARRPPPSAGPPPPSRRARAAPGFRARAPAAAHPARSAACRLGWLRRQSLRRAASCRASRHRYMLEAVIECTTSPCWLRISRRNETMPLSPLLVRRLSVTVATTSMVSPCLTGLWIRQASTPSMATMVPSFMPDWHMSPPAMASTSGPCAIGSP